MSATWFTSDLHLGHAKVAEIRGFNSPLEHDVELEARWRSVVRPDDIVWVLGDLCISGLSALAPLSYWPGRKRLVFGNHDAGHPMHREAHKHLHRYLEVFEYAAPFAQIKLAGQKVLLSHFPYRTDRGEARYTQWRIADEGLTLLHGHTHLADQRGHRDFGKNATEALEVHVGLDAWNLTPVAGHVVEKIIRDDHHVCDSGGFDRTLCPSPCDSMHFYCTECGKRQDQCAFERGDTREGQ